MQRCNGIGKRKSPPYRFLMIGQTKSRGPVFNPPCGGQLPLGGRALLAFTQLVT
jgi:hypothetical protein